MALVELRIHGVSGTPPAAMLDTPLVHRVAGDADAGFWRPLAPASEELADPDRTLEGYSWGGLTSRAATSAVWVLLAPFALVNAGAAMHLPRGTAPRARRAIAPGFEGMVVRAFALLLTLSFTLTAYIAATDLGGWQCGNDPACLPRHRSTRWLTQHWLDTPARHVAVTSLVPLALVLALWMLARRSWQRYEMFPVDGTVASRPEGEQTPFDDPAFWNGRERAETLRHAHVAAALALIASLSAYVDIAARPDGRSRTIPLCLLVVAIALLAGAVVVAALPRTEATASIAKFGWIGAGIVTAATLVFTAFAAKLSPAKGKQLPGAANVLTVTLVAALVLIAVLFLRALPQFNRSRAAKLGLWGFGTSCTSVVALVLGGAYCAGVLLRAADFLGVPRSAAQSGAPNTIVVPDVVTWAALGVAVAVAVIVVWVIGVALRLLVLARAEERRLAPGFVADLRARGTRAAWASFDAEAKSSHDAGEVRRRRRIAAAIVRGRLTDRVGLVVGPAAAIAFAVAIVALVPAVAAGFFDAGWASDPAHRARFAGNAGSWLILVFVVTMIGVMYRSYRRPDLRREVGILWDLTTFWPRSAHPLAPPCYAERSVPEFAARTAFFRAGDPDYDSGPPTTGDVIISAHSQGTIISAAMLLRLTNTEGIALLTYGSPLRRLYAKYFPAYFGGNTLRQLEARLGGRWRNLYRETDPIGGPIALDGCDIDVLVPIPQVRQRGDTTYQPIEAHSNYQREPRYHEMVAVLARFPDA